MHFNNHLTSLEPVHFDSESTRSQTLQESLSQNEIVPYKESQTLSLANETLAPTLGSLEESSEEWQQSHWKSLYPAIHTLKGIFFVFQNKQKVKVILKRLPGSPQMRI